MTKTGRFNVASKQKKIANSAGDPAQDTRGLTLLLINGCVTGTLLTLNDNILTLNDSRPQEMQLQLISLPASRLEVALKIGT